MAAKLAKAGAGWKFPDGFAARTFGRAMSWACLGLAAFMVVVATAAVLANGAVISGGLASCERPGATPAGRACPLGITTTSFQVTYAADGHVIARRPLAAPPPNMVRWSPANIGSLVWSVTPLLLAGALWQGSGFFRGLARGQVFEASAVRRLRNFSMFGVAFLLSDALLESLVNAVLSLFGRESVRFSWPFAVLDAAHGHSAWSLSGGVLMEMVFAAVLVAMVSVLARAAAIAEDHAQIV
jgi:hypothetical protein